MVGVTTNRRWAQSSLMETTSPPADRTLDAREIDGPPFEPIVDAAESLAADETLLLVNGFEPVPLYDVLEDRGFATDTERVGPDEWHVRISRA